MTITYNYKMLFLVACLFSVSSCASDSYTKNNMSDNPSVLMDLDDDEMFLSEDFDLLFMVDEEVGDDDQAMMSVTPKAKPNKASSDVKPVEIAETKTDIQDPVLPDVVKGDEIEFIEKDAKKFGILPGDILRINVWKEEEMDREVLVLPDGTITFPLVGTVDAYGLSPKELEDAIIDRLATKIPDAPVTVSMVALNGHKITVIGQVQEPGEYVMPSAMGVMQALSQAGGLTAYADESDIIVIRRNADGSKEKIEYPYNAISNGRKLHKDIDLKPGDVVSVPTAGLF